jgi:hypothetical protein
VSRVPAVVTGEFSMQKKDAQSIIKEFEIRQTRQIIAIAIALFCVLLCAVLYKKPIFFEFSKSVLVGSQIVIIAGFFGFSVINWRCPACGKSLGSDIHKRGCKKCGVRLK